ncbi:MAG: patatin-like phospholipase family protein [Burkholderiales bacterium]
MSKFQRCMVMGGGGGRLGAYLGMHAAACEAGLAPDLVVGTCGGALAAALVHAEPDPARQLAWLASGEMYRFWAGFRAAPGATLTGALAAAALRWLDPRHAPRLPQVHARALFEAPAQWPGLPWREVGDTPEAVLLGARVLYAPHEAGRPRAGRKLFQQVLLCRPAVAARLSAGLGAGLAPLGGPAWPTSTVASDLAVRSDVALMDAVRISFGDMFYLPAAALDNDHFIGGVVDLLPVELATRWADKVWIERKPAATWTQAPAWRHVLGIDARRRLRAVDHVPVALRIDTRRLGRALPHQLLDKRVQWRTNRLQLQGCASEADYRQLVHAHWQEGQRLVREALADSHARANA